MSRAFKKAAHPAPVDFSAIEADWMREGFSFGIFRDPPGQEWNNFTHRSDEYVLVAEGKLKIDVGSETAVCEPGDLVCIPRQVPHSLKTLSTNGSVWGTDKLTFLTENFLPIVAFLSHCTRPRRKGTQSK